MGKHRRILLSKDVKKRQDSESLTVAHPRIHDPLESRTVADGPHGLYTWHRARARSCPETGEMKQKS